MTLGYQTHPMRVGAPLPVEMTDISEPNPEAIRLEIKRAKVELMYAIARHRQAWYKMRQHAKAVELEHQAKGLPHAFLESDPVWSIIVGDVRWWRDEMAAQATTIQALQAMAGMTGLNLDTKWAEATSFDDLGAGRRTFLSTETRRRTVRSICQSWNPRYRPTKEQYDAAVVWQANAQELAPVHRELTDSIIAAYRAA